MTLDQARESLAAQAGLGGVYNGNSAKPILSAVTCAHGQAAVDGLICELNLSEISGFQPGDKFEGGVTIKH